MGTGGASGWDEDGKIGSLRPEEFEAWNSRPVQDAALTPHSEGPSRRTSLAQPCYHKGGSALVLQVLPTEAFLQLLFLQQLGICDNERWVD